MPAQPRVSITFTALIWSGILLIVAGIVITFAGITNAVQIDASLGSFHLKATSGGLAMIAIGAAMAVVVAVRLPKNVRVFSFTETLEERILRISIKPIVGLGLVALVAFVVLILKG